MQELEKQIASFGSEREKHVKAAQAKLKAARARCDAVKAALKARLPASSRYSYAQASTYNMESHPVKTIACAVTCQLAHGEVHGREEWL